MALSVKGSRELQAVILALKSVDKTLRPEMYKRSRELILPDWTGTIQEKINAKPNVRLHTALLMKGARAQIGTQGVAVLAAQSTRPIRKGSNMIPANQREYGFGAAEFGAKPKIVAVQGRRGDTRYRYNRKVNTGFLPNNRKGKFVFRAANDIMTRSVALWVQSVVQVIQEAVDKGETNG